MVFPIIIINSERSFIKAKLNKNFEIENFDNNKKFYLYFFIDENQDYYDPILKGHFTLPILLTNLKNLPELIDFIEDGVKNITIKSKEDLANNRYKIPYEILFSDIFSFEP